MVTHAQNIKNIIIVGGGTAGWMTAALLGKTLGTRSYNVTLVESEEISTVGVGEATIPPISLFNDVLGLEETEFVRETNATFKLGINFINWRQESSQYFHPFGQFGLDMDGIGFNSYWLRLAGMGGSPDFGRFNFETMAARENRFGRATASTSSDSVKLNYAFQFDAHLYAKYLRRYSEKRGVVRIEGKIISVQQDPHSGYVQSIETDNGKIISGDLFFDCSGFRGLLIEDTLKSGYEDWSHWLPCNRAVAVPCESLKSSQGSPASITPYTTATAQEAGWQWRIPLQHRTGNGYIFCNDFMSEDEATTKLMTRLDGKPLKDPKTLKFVTGHRKKVWNKNVVALGLASGFLEPLESTSIHLIQICLTRFIAMMPKREFNERVISEYNRFVVAEYENIKDFVVAHYKITDREDTPFWKQCKHMEIPDSLKARIELFEATGYANSTQTELFREASWFALFMGQGKVPKYYHPIADVISSDELKIRMAKIRTNITNKTNALPLHSDYIAAHCQFQPMSA